MPYIVDTYNAVYAGAAMGGALSGLTVRKLCQWVVASAGGRQPMKVTLVLDGRAKPDEPSENEFPGIRIVYSGVGVSADKVIGQMVEVAGNKKKVTVVTNDRAVALHARRNFANAMSCEAFLAALIGAKGPVRGGSVLPPHKTQGTGTSGETEHWLKEFGIKPEPKAAPKIPTGDEIEDLDIEDLLGPR
ncbi:MAG TPA: NYN domain-containing protein [Phycisphaerae bacterium]|nr:NYN domain-containing protein [Phycisphaerae bacterium]